MNKHKLNYKMKMNLKKLILKIMNIFIKKIKWKKWNDKIIKKNRIKENQDNDYIYLNLKLKFFKNLFISILYFNN